MGQTVSGQLAGDDCQGSIGAYMDRWQFDLGSETSVRIDLSSTSFDAYLELRQANGVMVAENDDAGSLNSRIITTLPAGSYVIVARSLGPDQIGAYQLSMREGPDCRPVGELTIGSTATGTISADDCVFEWGIESIDNWTLTLSEPTDLRIELTSVAFDEVLLIRDPLGDILWIADGFGPLGFARAELVVPAGTWTLVALAANPDGGGSYELSVGLRPPCTPGTPVVLGETFNGTIDLEDCLFQSWAPSDSLELTLATGTPLDFILKSGDMVASFVVVDQSGREVLWGWPDYLTRTARVSATLGAGTYALYAFADGFPFSGTYQLTVSEIICEPPTPIVVGTSETGRLDVGDCPREGGAFQDTWSFELTTDETVRIDLESSELDAWLSLTDADGVLLATDDDGGVGLNSRIEIALAAGTYFVQTSTLGQGVVGDYTLTVAVPVAPSPAQGRVDAGLDAVVKIDPTVSGPRMPWAERRADILEALTLRLRGVYGSKDQVR
jgi:hypothetical protein